MGLRLGSLVLDTPVLLAPMTRLTDVPFRRLCRKMGAGAVYTEMVSAEGLVRGASPTKELIKSDGTDRPLFVQLFGSSPQVMGEAAWICQEEGADGIDINMGCPVPKVVRTGAGAALLKDVNRAVSIMESVREKISIPLTIKMRSGWSVGDMTFLGIAKAAQRSGVDGLIFHPRARSETFGTPARWELIKMLVDSTCLPVVGNGDVRSPEDVLRMMKVTRCQGVMIGRAAVGNPWIFSQTVGILEGRGEDSEDEGSRLWEGVTLHMEAILSHYGPERGLQVAKLHLPRYFKGLPYSSNKKRMLHLTKTWKELEELVGVWRDHVRRPLSQRAREGVS